ncbi:heavy metal translocating P-type ATPase [Ferdinandcohnia quinoae]|uniref:Cd(2+)-exporting ATPase n=1 Tax=Fredinandcohnia quinoae TaxID=2918902 RepID=A0AAW5DUK4_9BACI|nr:cation-translocating P-type ATPase [Fredinandcohnia sp. SECRCQ15]MCH1624317.1 cation-translocating P-type ATPase [Fredinandcohnia sp. SECRCQ15]
MKQIQKKYLVIVSGILIAIALLLRWNDQLTLANIFLLLATVIAGYTIVMKAIQSLRLKIISIELLVTIAVTGAIIIGEYIESAAVTFLFLLGAYLESRTLEKTRSSLKSLLELAPLHARVLQKGEKILIAAEDVKEKDTVFVHSGEKIPVDGKVLGGNASVNEATITGEAIPVQKAKEDSVYSGTILDTGFLEIEAVKIGEDTTFSKILQLVEEAQDTKARTQKYLEKFAAYYTPSILFLALVVYLFTKDLTLSLTFLVISCPGALVISAPVSIVAGVGNGAKKGILIKGGEVMESLAKVDVIAFDKTGTLTVGSPEVSTIKTYGLSKKELLILSAEAEVFSEHHLGKAIVNEAKKNGFIFTDKAKDFQVLKGKGVQAEINGNIIKIGNRKLMEENNIILSKEMNTHIFSEETMGRTAVMIAKNNKIVGVISISDEIRSEARISIEKLKEIGIKKIVMLTGDNSATAQKTAHQLQLDGYYAELLPEQKVQIINQLKKEGNKVAMVGDGINDAPAIAAADVGIAMGGAGTDVAMETADVVLMSDRLDRLSQAVKLARVTVQNMKQNMYFAVAVVAFLLIGVLAKTVFLATGMFIHEASVLLVILNAIRLVNYDNQHKTRIKHIKQFLIEKKV